MIIIYYIIIFLSSLLLADLGVILLFNVGTSFYFIDLFFIFFLLCFICLCIGQKFKNINTGFGLLIGSLLFSIFYGISKYGFRAIGEGRYIYWIFFFSVPVYFHLSGRLKTFRDFDKFFKITYLIVVASIILLLMIEILNGGRFFLAAENQEFSQLEDARGIRYLGSEETFHLGVAVVFLLIGQMMTKKKNILLMLSILVLTAIIIFTKNRTALISLFLSFLFVFISEGKGKLVLRLLFSFVALFFLFFLFFPTLANAVIAPLTSIFNISEDETGNWRLLVQAVAIEQGLKTPILGQGFGGYFEYYIEVLDQTFEFPPHSIYVYLFQKSGFVGLTIYIVALISLIRESSGLKQITKSNFAMERYRIFFKVLFVAQIPYGFAYNFTTFFGLYIGMFIVLKYLIRKNLSKESICYEPS
jgi:O-antigen ligase